MNIHLFSSPGRDDLRYIIEACRPHLEGKDDPMVAYLPLASLYAERWHSFNQSAFAGLGTLVEINAELMTQKEMENLVREAALIYIPGGNTFLLNHRLHTSGIVPYLKKKIQNGLPLVGFSAGMVICGPNILTSRDLNSVGTNHFDGFHVTPFNFLAHYPKDAYGQSVLDDWLADYHFFHDNPVIMMCDDAYLKIDGKKTSLVRGEAYLWRNDQEKEKLDEGTLIHI